MKILFSYIGRYKSLVFLALVLASINQVFSLLDPFIFGKILDRFATHPKDFTETQFMTGVAWLIAAAIGVAMVSRTAKAFQDYSINLIIQKLGADIYTDGLKHTLQIAYNEFEDQRSGETLNILQKVRTDAERFIMSFINILFVSIVGLVFVMVYAFTVQPGLILLYLFSAAGLSFFISFLSKRIKKVQMTIMSETKQLAGSTT
ncbi:MAG: ABC transporter transmembrane domain-containing protein, partial [Crocinitomicaceae bacterium]|nr:ABC transporter transmembrane domain-containing protein [Crocinitomicaceae bacterium]